MEEKHFWEWIEVKEDLHFNARVPRISEGEVWWCSFGENVGIEINGKSSTFTRPVLIMKKLSSLGFMGIPLTSQKKSGSWYIGFFLLYKYKSVRYNVNIFGNTRPTPVARSGGYFSPKYNLLKPSLTNA